MSTSIVDAPMNIGVLLRDGTLQTLPQSTKLRLVNYTPHAKFKYPTKYMNGCNRHFKPDWVQSHSWLHYSASEDSAYCKACALFAPSDKYNKNLAL